MWKPLARVSRAAMCGCAALLLQGARGDDPERRLQPPQGGRPLLPFPRTIRAYDEKHRTYGNRGTIHDLRRHYREGDKLGEGTFAVVKKGLDLQTKEAVAIKEIDKARSDEEARANEVKVMEKLGRHPNLIGLLNVYESQDVLFVVLDLAQGGELFDRIVSDRELSENDAAKLFRGAVAAIDHLHSRHIAHLDIKPENLLLKRVPKREARAPQLQSQSQSQSQSPSASASEAKKGDATAKRAAAQPQKKRMSRFDDEEVVALADFGLAVQDENETFDLCVGTPAYWAPEMVRRERFGPAVDMWALGCVLYILLCGVHPFDVTGQAPEAEILAKVATGKYDQSSTEFKQLSSAAKDLILHLLDPNPAKRYTAKQALEHPWLTSERSEEPLPQNGVNKLRGFRVLTLIKSGMTDLLGQAEDDLFSGLDANGDGFLSRDELRKGLAVVGVQLDDAEIDAFLKLVDTDGDEQISREEFNAVLKKTFEGEAVPSSEHARLEDLATLFRAFDKDDDSYISPEDVHHVLSLLGSAATRSSVQMEWARADADGDGRISFAEFVRFVRETESEKRKKLDGGAAATSGVHTLKTKRDLLKSRR